MCGKARQDAKDDNPASSPVTKKHAPPPKAERQRPRTAIVDASHKGAKRKSEEPRPEPKKRQKKIATPNPSKDKVDDSDAEPSSIKFIGFGHEEQESEGDQENSMAAEQAPDTRITANGSHSESELSELFDEARVPKNKRKKSEPSTKPDKTAKSKTGKLAAASTLTSHEEEVKRLQGWLVKCGIRKIWGVYLARFETPKDKISHLKSMLKDAGMESRYSEEKARQIKEERELRADLEDIQKRNQKWGQKGDGAEESTTGRPKRKVLAKGLQELELFANDGEESD